jgi:uncharacterized repeat protein (TIGR03833 family)
MSSYTSTRGQSRGRSNPFRSRGRGRGRGGSSFNGERNPNIPTYNQVLPGTSVSIVLKEDQPTGRQVQGVVGEILTGGNHPRGIKVRLKDGRVGRVQKLVSEDGKTGDGDISGLGSNSELSRNDDAAFAQLGIAPQANSVNSTLSSPRPAQPPPKYQDFRYDGYEAPEREEANLEDYVVFKTKVKGKKGKKKIEDQEAIAEAQGETSASTMTIACPMCGDFDGDEAAVAHHVEGHFE